MESNRGKNGKTGIQNKDRRRREAGKRTMENAVRRKRPLFVQPDWGTTTFAYLHIYIETPSLKIGSIPNAKLCSEPRLLIV